MNSLEPLGTPVEVAEYLKVSVVTLAQWRQAGRGPQWSKVGRWVRYDWADVREWVSRGGDRNAQ
ncbi:Helix-turn-helix domain [Mycobacteroides abscessus subsp. massiliense]|uniref:helix-turn-helix transcriptional regulator n=1 Tax=Mycobacteroides abscessus TaxID=36809 RepID=UPI0009A65A2D|nr:helix-turn-helix domain-containing protein [Mycobacteroides abscessus]SKS09918.1 Helix-turn-helix domain [Mycobacteroides abscessus subsp. massiliense]